MSKITDDLVDRFAVAMRDKLAKAEVKYGYTDEWLEADWEQSCRDQMNEHIRKGDPTDVAIYAAFMWHHGWSTWVE